MSKASLLLLVIAPAITGGCDSASTGTSAAPAACARVSACALPGDASGSFGECRFLLEHVDAVRKNSSSDSRLLATAIDCLLAAGSCDELRTCYQPTPDQLAICESTSSDTCSGNVLVNCTMKEWSSNVTAYDCARAGMVCGQSDDDARCGLATCDPANTAATCAGDRLITCEEQGHVLFAEDCASQGQTCRDAAGGAACVGSVACDEATSDFRCDGTVMVQCDRGSEKRRDCAATLGPQWTCLAEVTRTENGRSQSLTCVPVAKDCTIGENESCADGVVTYCDAGHVTTFDCRSLGFAGCTTRQTATTTTATCVQ